MNLAGAAWHPPTWIMIRAMASELFAGDTMEQAGSIGIRDAMAEDLKIQVARFGKK